MHLQFFNLLLRDYSIAKCDIHNVLILSVFPNGECPYYIHVSTSKAFYLTMILHVRIIEGLIYVLN